MDQQLRNASIDQYFERSFCFRPFASSSSLQKCTGLGRLTCELKPLQLRLVGAHVWDVLGAMGAGCLAAFVARPCKALYPLAAKPDIVENDLLDLADQIVKTGHAEMIAHVTAARSCTKPRPVRHNSSCTATAGLNETA